MQNLMQTKKALDAYANNKWIGITSKYSNYFVERLYLGIFF